MTTVQIRYGDIPFFLREGAFYRNLDNGDPESIIDVPADYFSATCIAENLAQFEQLLRVMTFWALDNIPTGVLDFCKDFDPAIWEWPASELPCEIGEDILPDLRIAYGSTNHATFDEVISTDRWEVITHRATFTSRDEALLGAAARAGNLRLMKFLHEENFVWQASTCAFASGCGSLECLRYARQNGCPWNAQVYVRAAAFGHLSCMQYAFEQGLEWHKDVCKFAALHGHLDCLKFAHENSCPWNADVYKLAARGGHLDCMKYAHREGLEWSPNACRMAAYFGHLSCLQYAHENGCPWHVLTLGHAAMQGHASCLQYALEHGCPLDGESRLVSKQLACLELFHIHNIPLTVAMSSNCASCSDVACLRFLFEHGCPYDNGIIVNAVRSGSLEVLKYLVEDQLLITDENTFISALLRGDLSCLQYLLDQGCPYMKANFSDRKSLLLLYDAIDKTDNPDFALCVELAIERGWVPGQHFVMYIIKKGLDNCKEVLTRNGCNCDFSFNTFDSPPPQSTPKECFKRKFRRTELLSFEKTTDKGQNNFNDEMEEFKQMLTSSLAEYENELLLP